MRWPWQKPERREAIGGYTDIIGRLIEAQASGATANASQLGAWPLGICDQPRSHVS